VRDIIAVGSEDMELCLVRVLIGNGAGNDVGIEFDADSENGSKVEMSGIDAMIVPLSAWIAEKLKESVKFVFVL
jgi:hypothetical protein